MEQSTAIAKRLFFDEDVSTSTDLDFVHRRMEDLAKLPKQFEELEKEAVGLAELEMFSDSYLGRLEEMVSGLPYEYIELAGNENCFEYGRVDDLEMQLENLKSELSCVQAETARTSQEIENLSSTAARDVNQLAHELLMLETCLDSSKFEDKDQNKSDQSNLIDQLENQLKQLKMEEAQLDEFKRHENWMLLEDNYKFEAMKLKDQLNQKRADWRNLQKLDDAYKRIEAVKLVEDLLCDMKDVSFINDCIQLSLKTSIPAMGGSLCQFKIDCIKESLVVEHVLQIKVVPETMALQDAELVPNDVPIDDIVQAAKKTSDSVTPIALSKLTGQLEFLVREIQFHVYCHNIRLAVLECDAKVSRNLFQYSDRDQVITVHVFGGIKAFIKVPCHWPLSMSPLRLISLKPSDESAGDISLAILCKAMEILNSLELSRRHGLLHFIDAVEEVLLQQMQKNKHSETMQQ